MKKILLPFVLAAALITAGGFHVRADVGPSFNPERNIAMKKIKNPVARSLRSPHLAQRRLPARRKERDPDIIYMDDEPEKLRQVPGAGRSDEDGDLLDALNLQAVKDEFEDRF